MANTIDFFNFLVFLDEELKKLEEMGIEFVANHKVKSPHDLLGDFDDVFFGIGATLSTRLKLNFQFEYIR